MNHRVFYQLLCALLLLGSSPFAWSADSAESVTAADRYDPAHKARFRAADTDNSHGLSRREVEAALPRVLLRHFDDIDTDANGELSPDELVAMREREEARREARRQARVDELRGATR